MHQPLLTRHSGTLGAAEAVLARVRIVLVETSHSGNLGAAARAIKVMGLSRLTLVTPKVGIDDVARARAAGADHLLDAARVVATLDEALEGCVFAVAATARPREIAPNAFDARTAVQHALAAAVDGDIAFVLGNETSGLTSDHVRRCQALAHIPAAPGYSSLNLAAAVQVFAYEVRMALITDEQLAALAEPAGVVDTPASADDVEGLIRHCETALAEIGFYKADNPGRLIPRLRRLFGRARLEREEVNILRGILNAAVKHRGR